MLGVWSDEKSLFFWCSGSLVFLVFWEFALFCRFRVAFGGVLVCCGGVAGVFLFSVLLFCLFFSSVGGYFIRGFTYDTRG